MPTKRFYNLSDAKRGKIREAAIREFTEHSYEKVSINQIVRAAGISRGSFYTYFDSKMDVLMFLLEEYVEISYQTACRCLEKARGDVWDMLEQLMEEGAEIARQTKENGAVRLFRLCFSQEEVIQEISGSWLGRICETRSKSLEEKTYRECVGVSLVSMDRDEFHAFFQLALYSIWSELGAFLSEMSPRGSQMRFQMKKKVLKNGVAIVGGEKMQCIG